MSKQEVMDAILKTIVYVCDEVRNGNTEILPLPRVFGVLDGCCNALQAVKSLPDQ